MSTPTQAGVPPPSPLLPPGPLPAVAVGVLVLGVLVGVSPGASVRWPEGEAPGDAPPAVPGSAADPWPPPPPPPPAAGEVGAMVRGGTQPVPAAGKPSNRALPSG